jgi:hypothetical protein
METQTSGDFVGFTSDLILTFFIWIVYRACNINQQVNKRAKNKERMNKKTREQTDEQTIECADERLVLI